MTTLDDRPTTPRFPPITLEQLRSGKCGNGHQLPKDPERFYRVGGHIHCLGCESSNLRPPDATECVNGHDITRPDALEPNSNRCLECKRARQRAYSARRRAKTPAVPTLDVSQPRGKVTKPRQRAAGYLGGAIPSAVVRMNAACGPDTAHLFERRRAREPLKKVRARHQIAATICARCPVFTGCAQWYRDEPADTEMLAAVRLEPGWSE